MGPWSRKTAEIERSNDWSRNRRKSERQKGSSTLSQELRGFVWQTHRPTDADQSRSFWLLGYKIVAAGEMSLHSRRMRHSPCVSAFNVRLQCWPGPRRAYVKSVRDDIRIWQGKHWLNAPLCWLIRLIQAIRATFESGPDRIPQRGAGKTKQVCQISVSYDTVDVFRWKFWTPWLLCHGTHKVTNCKWSRW